MKCLRFLFAVMLVFALSQVARADDFKLGVQDAPVTYQYTYTGVPLTNVAFHTCGVNEGCVTILNDSGKTLTSLVIDVPVTSYTSVADGANCLTGAGSGFANCTASLIDNNTLYQFDITGLDVPAAGYCTSGDTFEIEETGVSARNFPKIEVGPMSPTPEPASFWLLTTGVLLFGGFIYRRRFATGAFGS